MFPPGIEFRPSEQSPFEHHLGVAYIQAYLAKHGITSKQIVPPQGSTLNDCVTLLSETGAKIIGFTCYDNNYFLVRKIASLLKQRRPECVVIAGGPTATFSDELLLANTPDIDLCVRFEGEETTLELAYLVFEGLHQDSLQEIEGITFRRDRSIIRTQDRQLFGYDKDKERSLDGLPSPYLTGMLKGNEGAGIISARGCTHHCTYCSFSAISRHTTRYHSIDRVIAELQYISTATQFYLIDSTPQAIWILDDAFTLNARRAKKICERIIDEGIRLRLSCLCRADNLDRELVELMSQAGFVEIAFGVESAVPRVLNNIKKVYKSGQKLDNEDYALEKRFLSRVKEGIDLAKHYRMATGVSIILGLPGETMDDGLKTIEFVRGLGVDSYEHNYLRLFPGTELFTNAYDYGIKLKPSEFLLPYDTQYAYPVQEIPCLNNSSLKDYSLQLARVILKTFAGGPDIFKVANNGIIQASIERSDGEIFFDSLIWLSQPLAVGGRVVILGKDNDTIDDFDLVSMAKCRIGWPTDECYYLKNYPISDTELVYEIINKPFHGQQLQWDPRFPLVKLSKCIKFAKKHDPTQAQIFPIYCMKDKTDVNFLIELSDKLCRFINNGKLEPRVWLDGVFLDGCRWHSNLCPALKMRRSFINKNGEILPCMTGQSLGSLSDSVQDLRNNAKKIYAEIRMERKCDGCPADSRCSKCLFPYPLNQQEYCELQRANLNISGVVTKSNLVNTVDFRQ